MTPGSSAPTVKPIAIFLPTCVAESKIDARGCGLGRIIHRMAP
jgi:hypothetical protein